MTVFRSPAEARRMVDDSEGRLANFMVEEMSKVIGRDEAEKLVPILCEAPPLLPELTPLEFALIKANERP